MYKKLPGNRFFLMLLTIVLFLVPLSLNLEPLSAEALTIGECTDLRDVGTCVANGILSFYEIIIFYFTQLVLVIVGYMFDLILFFSLNSDFYRGGLMQTGWEIVRDFTNIIFIFALLTMAFKLVLNQDDGKTKSTLVKTILVSLVINFSLFFTFIVIDSSNLLARVFYNRIEADGAYQTHQQDTSRNQAANNAQTKITQLASELTKGQPSVSLAIASKINPQKIITQSGADNFILGFAILTSAGILNILMIYVFGSLALLFLGRSLGLMISGIIAPLAFASITVPFLSSQKYIGFGNWIKEMIALAFMAPVFMFFMYLIVTFLGNEGALRSLTANNNTGVLATIMQTYIFFMIIGGLILLAKKVTTSMAGELGSMAAKGVAGVTTALATGAAIAATGGAAVAGRALTGAGNIAQVASKGKYGKRASRWGEGLKSTKFDVTKVPGFNSMANASGVSGLGKMVGKVTSVSGKDIENKTKYAATAVVAGAKDMMSGRSYAEQEAAEEKKRKERREQSEKGDDGVYGWEKKMDAEKKKVEETKAGSEIVSAREAELEKSANAGITLTNGPHAGKTHKDALEAAEKDANDPVKIKDHKKDVKDAEEKVEDSTKEVKKEQAKVQKGKEDVQELNNNITKIQADINNKLSQNKNANISALESMKSTAETALSTAKGTLASAETALSTAETTLETDQKNLKDTIKADPNKILDSVKQEIDVTINTVADEKVALGYDGKNAKLAEKIRNRKIKIGSPQKEEK